MEIQGQLSERLKVKLDQLSDGHRKVAKYLMEDTKEAAFKTAYQIGKEVGVSESTVIRLSYALDLDGFSELQKLIRKEVLKSQVYEHWTSTETATAKDNIFAEVIARDIVLLNQLLNDRNEKVIWEIVDAIIEAEQVLIVGQRVSFGPAYWFSFMLNLFLGKGNLHNSSKDIVSEMADLPSKAIIIVVSFPRYTNDPIKLATIAKEKGMKVIGITDNFLSPIGRISDLLLTTQTNTLSGADSGASITSLLNLIITGISKKLKNEVTDRLELLEKEYERHQTFVDY